MPYELIGLGNMSGGMNEAFPPSRIRENECALLEDEEYIDENVFPQTRRGSQFLARFDDPVAGIMPFLISSDQDESHCLVVTTESSVNTEFWGREPAGSFTSRGTATTSFAGAWAWSVMNSNLVFGSSFLQAAKKWPGTGNVANLGGTPPEYIYALAAWNNRMFAVSNSDPYTIEFCTLGDVEDWTDADPVSGTGFVTMTDSFDRIISLHATRERLIIFREHSIWQIITSLPNTAPDGWRLEVLMTSAGSISKYSPKDIVNDVFFVGTSGKVQSLSATERFGDFEIADVSDNIILERDTRNGYTSAVIGNKYLITSSSDPTLVYCGEITRSGTVRWTRFNFRHKTGAGVEETALVELLTSTFVYGEVPRAIFLSSTFDVCFWPTNATGDDVYKDQAGDPNGEAKFQTRVKTRAWDGGSIIEAKQMLEYGVAFEKLSTTGFIATADLRLTLYLDESTSGTSVDLTDAAATTTHHEKRIRPSGNRRFHSFQLELSTSKLGLGVRIKDFDAKVAQASRAFHDTVAQL